MKLRTVTAIAAVSMAPLVAGCTSKPIYNVESSPVTTPKAASLDQVSRAIVRAGASLGWQMAQQAPGKITGTLMLRDHKAVVDVSFDTKTYSIAYKDSANLGYNGTEIHRNYNSWIQNLDRHIQAQLIAL
jgi:hypothetical protein